MKQLLKKTFTNSNEDTSHADSADFRRKKSAVFSEICEKYFQMKKIISLTAFILIFIFSNVFANESKVPIDKPTLKINPDLLGNWEAATLFGGSIILKISKKDDFIYKIYKDEKEIHFASLSEINDVTFLNLWENKPDSILPEYKIYKIEMSRGIISSNQIEDTMLKKFSTSASLKKYISENMNDSSFFSDNRMILVNREQILNGEKQIKILKGSLAFVLIFSFSTILFLVRRQKNQMKKLIPFIMIPFLLTGCMSYYRTATNFNSLNKGMTKAEFIKWIGPSETPNGSGHGKVKGGKPSYKTTFEDGKDNWEVWGYDCYVTLFYPSKNTVFKNHYLDFFVVDHKEYIAFKNGIVEKWGTDILPFVTAQYPKPVEPMK